MEIFESLYDVIQNMVSTLDVEELLKRVLDNAILGANAERGFILINEGGKFSLRIARNIDKKDIEAELSRTVIKEIMKERKPILTFDATVDPRFKNAPSIAMSDVRSICAIPLLRGENLIGVIYVDSSRKRGLFSSDTLKFLTLFSNLASIAFENAKNYSQLKEEHKILKRGEGFGEIVGESPPMQRLFNLIEKTAESDCPVLILGESGTGKELVAREIYKRSKVNAFVPVYCGSLPEGLIESELFGYRKGAFTDATRDKEGLFEAADEGIIFLDEMCDIPLSTQAKLLRVLQNGEVRRLGETKIRKVKVRPVAATNKDVQSLIKRGEFREDLYYRLNVMVVHIPPLRERRGDIPLLANHFLERYNKRYSKNISFTKDIVRNLEKRLFRGNVRELENLVHRFVVTEDIPPEEKTSLDKGLITLEEIEQNTIEERLRQFGDNKKKTSESLGIPLRTLYYKISKYNKMNREP